MVEVFRYRWGDDLEQCRGGFGRYAAGSQSVDYEQGGSRRENPHGGGQRSLLIAWPRVAGPGSQVHPAGGDVGCSGRGVDRGVGQALRPGGVSPVSPGGPTSSNAGAAPVAGR